MHTDGLSAMNKIILRFTFLLTSLRSKRTLVAPQTGYSCCAQRLLRVNVHVKAFQAAPDVVLLMNFHPPSLSIRLSCGDLRNPYFTRISGVKVTCFSN